jgi:hypothetical protein
VTGTPRLSAANPAVDLSCAFGLGFVTPQSAFLDDLALGNIPPVRDVHDGVEVSFAVELEEAVRRYMEIESRRRPALNFSVRKTAGAVVLTVTGSAEPKEAYR